MNNEVNFVSLSQEKYDNLENKDVGTFYRTENNVYLGTILLASNIATPNSLGIVKPDNEGIVVDDEGQLHITWGQLNEIIKSVPSQDVGTPLVYTGELVKAKFADYDTNKMNVTGDTGINAGNYVAEFTPKFGYAWTGDNSDSKEVPWKIDKLQSTIELDTSDVTLDASNPEKQIEFSLIGDGDVSAVSSDESVVTTGINDNKISIVATQEPGSADVSVEVTESINCIPPEKKKISVICNFITSQAFSDISLKQIVDLVKKSDIGELNLSKDCGWKVGQEKTFILPAIESTGEYEGESWEVDESQPEQEVTLVLIATGSDVSLTSRNNLIFAEKVNNKTIPSYIVGLKNCLQTPGCMDIVGKGSFYHWKNSSRRQWCNTAFRFAMSCAKDINTNEVIDLSTIFKQFKISQANRYDDTYLSTTTDYFSLFAAKEIYASPSYTDAIYAGVQAGETYGSNLTEFNSLRYIKYNYNNIYKTLGNNGDKCKWWTRSAWWHSNNTNGYCCVPKNSSTRCDFDTGSVSLGIAPFGCI